MDDSGHPLLWVHIHVRMKRDLCALQQFRFRRREENLHAPESGVMFIFKRPYICLKPCSKRVG